MAATVRASIATGAGATLASAETGIKFNRDESQTGTTAPIPKPTATGTAFSWPKVLTLEITVADAATSISNRRIHRASAPSAGLALWYRDDAAVYNRPVAVASADSGTDDSTPTGYTAMPSTATVYDAASSAATPTGRSGDYVAVALGVSNLYVGGAGSAIALPNIVVTYDES